MVAKKKESPKPAEAPANVDTSNVVELYANFAGVSVTPFDFNISFARAGAPVGAPEGVPLPITSHLTYVARIAMPVAVLPLLAQLLEQQVAAARKAGIIPPVQKQTKKRE